MTKTRVAVLRGGLSDEYAVSLATGANVLAEIDRELFHPLDIVITRGGEWLMEGRTRFPEHILHAVDVVFIALHGTYGEDGTLQRLLDRFCVKYTGSKAMPSSVAMHKALTKESLRHTGIKMAPHLVVNKGKLADVYALSEKIVDLFGPQYFIKPIASGSSVGTMMVKNAALLPQALRDALDRFDEVIVEKRIPGREATCGVIENFRNEQLYALPPIEIVPPASSDFFDAEVKYNGTTKEICPGLFPHETKREIEELSKMVHETLGLSQYSRSDFIVSDDGVYFLEVNTLPGLTKESLLPKAVQAVGSSYRSFITHLLTEAMSH